MSTPMYELEFESEWEGEDEYEFEAEDEGEYEGEEFFGRLAGLARRAAQNPMLRRVGLQAARSALGGLRGMGPVGGIAAGALGGFIPQREYEGEWEYEGEYEGEYESFVNPQLRLSREALMAHLGNAAASAESEEEAEAFIGALVPLAAQLAPRIAPAVMRAAPQLIRGISNVAQRLRRNPATQQLVRTLPTIARNTVGSLARQARQGRPITARNAVRTLAQQTSRVLSSPRQATQAYRRNRLLDRRFHRAARGPVGAGAGGFGAGMGAGAGGMGVGAGAGASVYGGGFDQGGFDPAAAAGGFDVGNGGFDPGAAGGGFDDGAADGGLDTGAEGMW